MAARLPNPGQDTGNWGTILNDFLSQSLNVDGTLKPIASSKVTGLSSVANTGSYSDLQNKPTIPTQASDIGAVATNGLDTATAALVTGGSTTKTALNATYASIASPTFTGSPTAPTQTVRDDSTKIATTAYADTSIALATPITFSAAVAIIGVTSTSRAYGSRTLTGARMRVAAAPVGSSLIVQVQHFDGSVWTTLGTMTVISGSTVEVTSSFTQNQLVGNLVRLNVTSVGSMTASTGVVVDVIWT